VRRLQALRLRLRQRHPDRHHRHDLPGRADLRPGAGGAAMNSATTTAAAPTEAARPARAADPMRPLAREWSRFTPRQRLARWMVWLGVVAAVAWAVRSIDIIPEFLADA